MERPALLGIIITDRPTDQTNNQPTHQQINREGNEWSSHVTQKREERLLGAAFSAPKETVGGRAQRKCN